MTDSDRALRRGTLLHGRYRVEKVLGEGGFGITYLVTDLHEQREAAVKEYMPVGITSRDRRSGKVMVKSGDEEAYGKFREKFLDEARIIYRYRMHPNIISVSHLFSENCTAYYVMEFIDGMDLDELLKIRGGRITWKELHPIMAQVAEALREVHKGGVVHCDISPDNIFILQGGQVKLIDFGAAKSQIGGETTLIFMKKGYAPPEQYIYKGKLGPWTDIYALAVTIYRAYTGRMPPGAPERLEADRVIMPTQMGLAVPCAAWEAALKKGLALRQEERFQTIEEFWTALNEADDGSGGTRLVLEGKQGFWAEKQIWPSGEVLFGTDRSRCQVSFPSETPGISRVHFRIWDSDGELWIMDMGSRYGTYIERERLSPGLGYRLKPGMKVTAGVGQIFEAVIPETS